MGGLVEWSGSEVERRLFKVSCGGGARRRGRFLKPVLVLSMCWKTVSKYGVSVRFSVSFGWCIDHLPL